MVLSQPSGLYHWGVLVFEKMSLSHLFLPKFSLLRSLPGCPQYLGADGYLEPYLCSIHTNHLPISVVHLGLILEL